jgi:predicted nucleic acid-binding protein
MAAVISDTSVINYLAAIDQTELLRIQFERIFVPPAVWRELPGNCKESSPCWIV